MACAALALLAGSRPATAGPAYDQAMGTYYAALVSSARGSIDATNRHLLLLASRWDAASREARHDVPPALAQDPAWATALDKVTALVAKARERARQRDITGAHGDLEEIRDVLHEVRERHGVMVFDDYLTEYHEAVERVMGHAAGVNEIKLKPKDYDDILEDLRAADAAWKEITARAGAMGGSSAWAEASRVTAEALASTFKAVDARDGRAVAERLERLKANYFELLLAVSKARG